MLSMFDPAVNRMQKNVLFPLLHFGHHDHQKTLNINPTFIMQKYTLELSITTLHWKLKNISIKSYCNKEIRKTQSSDCGQLNALQV